MLPTGSVGMAMFGLLHRVDGFPTVVSAGLDELAGDESIGAATKRALDAVNATFFVTAVVTTR
jgi:hypothetical protein